MISTTPGIKETPFFLVPTSSQTSRKEIRGYTIDSGSLLGEGVFSRVYAGRKGDTPLAFKVNKASDVYFKNIIKEVVLLDSVQDVPHCIKLIDNFPGDSHEEHILVFKQLTQNIYEKYLKGKTRGMQAKELFMLGKDLCEALHGLKSKKIIHRDIKPENISFDAIEAETTLFDFGSSALESKSTCKLVQTRFYRSPEVLLEAKDYDCSIDMWSLGCLLYEMYTGSPLFAVGGDDGDPNVIKETLKKIIEKVGMPSDEYIAKGARSSEFFHFYFNHYEFDGQLNPTTSIEQDLLSAARMKGDSPKFAQDLARFIGSLLRYEDRMTAEEVLSHPFISTDFILRLDVSLSEEEIGVQLFDPEKFFRSKEEEKGEVFHLQEISDKNNCQCLRTFNNQFRVLVHRNGNKALDQIVSIDPGAVVIITKTPSNKLQIVVL